MSIHSRLKLLDRLKTLLNKSRYHKNFQFIIGKEWLDFFQKLTYLQSQTIRKYSLSDGISKPEKHKIKESDQGKQRTVPEVTTTTLQNEKKLSVLDQEKTVSVDLPNSAIKESYSIPQVLTTFIPKLGSKSKEVSTVSNWKNNIQSISTKIDITSRTRHILKSILEAESNASKRRRIEDLISHIEQFPETKNFAIKNNGVKILLLIQQTTTDENIQESIREALAVLGYINSLPNRGIRILAIDGGGIRGVLVIEMLKKLEQLTGQRIYQLFDYICGVSTGAILSVALGGHKKKSLDEISKLYKELSVKIFTQSPLWGTGKMMWKHAYYDTALWEKMLQEHVGTEDLIKTTRDLVSPKFSAISTIKNHERVMAYVFRNYSIPNGIDSQYKGSYRHKMWEAVRASAAAPSYFEEFRCGEHLHQDGGIMVNNPCAVAIHEAKQLWPNSSIQCVVSFGTGRAPHSLSNNVTNKVEMTSSWKDKFCKILDSATDTEAVHVMLNDLLPDHVYYRFNPYLTEMLKMVETRPEKIAQLEHDAAMYINRNEDKFQKVAKVLMQGKSRTQAFLDWIKVQKIIISS